MLFYSCLPRPRKNVFSLSLIEPTCIQHPGFPDPDCPGTPCPAHTYWRSEGGARCSRGGENPTETCTYLVTGPGSRHGLGAQPGTWSLRIPAMASSQGDVRSSPMAYPAVRPLPKLPLPLSTARHGSYLLVRLRVRPERHRAQS